MRQIDADGASASGKIVPVARSARASGAHIDHPQRVVPRDALVHARVPRDEHPEHDEQHRDERDRQRGGAA